MRRSIVAKGLVLAMEGDEIEESSAGEYEEAMDEVSQDVEEIDESEAEIDDIEVATDSAVDDAGTLEDIADVMEESVEKGEGLDETSAEIAEIAIESICERLGIKVEHRMLPATESFGSDNSRVAATRIALETADGILTRAWEAIKTALKTVRDKIVELYKKYLTALGSIKRGLQKLESEVNDFKGTTVKDGKGEINNKYIARALAGPNTDKTKVVDTGDLYATLSNHIQLTKAVVNSNKILNDAIKAMSVKIEDFDPSVIASQSDTFYSSFKAFKNSVLVGGVTLDLETAGEFSGWKSRLLFKFQETSKAEKVKTLKPGEIRSNLAEVKTLLTLTESYVKDADKYKQQIQALEKIADQAIKITKTVAETDDEKSNIKQLRQNFKAVNSTVNGSRKAIPSLNVKCIKAGMAYIKTSMSQY